MSEERDPQKVSIQQIDKAPVAKNIDADDSAAEKEREEFFPDVVPARNHGIPGIHLFQITEDELRTLESGGDKKRNFSGLFGLFFGAFLSSLLTLVNTPEDSTAPALAVVYSLTATTFIMSLFFGIYWLVVECQSKNLSQKIRDRKGRAT